MFESLVDIATLFLCTFVSTVVVAVFMTVMWLRDRKRVTIGLWAASMWVGSVAAILLAMRLTLPPFLTIVLGNFLAATAYGLMWAGLRAFDGLKTHPLAVMAGGFFWIAAYYLVPSVPVDVNARMIVMSPVIFAYSLLMATTVGKGDLNEHLPVRRIARIFFASHGFIYLCRIPFAILDPAPQQFAAPFSFWFSLFSLELFIHTVATSVTILLLIKERTEFQYKRAAETDELTGVMNRRRFVADIEGVLAASPRSGVLMIFDLDHFKAINDTWGHVAGDRVLEGFAAEMTRHLEPGMIFGRLGGEEFALFVPDTGRERGIAFGEKLRRATEAMRVEYRDVALSVTTSIGLAAVADAGCDYDELTAAADAALYHVKTSDRNRVACFEAGDLLRRMLEGKEKFASGGTLRSLHLR